jgi:hypothetical protein
LVTPLEPYCRSTPWWRVEAHGDKSEPVRRASVILWALRAVWTSLPFTVGPLLSDALTDTSRPVQVVASLGLWVSWAIGLGLSLVRTTVSLTALRLLAPAPLAAAIAAVITDRSGGWAGTAAALTGLVVMVLAFRGEVGRAFVEGSGYGDEARFPLRPPGPLLLGPLQLAWFALAACVVAGPLLLAAGAWLVGLVVTIAAIALLTVLPRRFHRLSRRFLVFVPAGLALHDHVALAETAMFRWTAIQDLRQALCDTEALDLTVNALGPALEITLTGPETLLLAASGRAPAVTVHAEAILCNPTLTRATLSEANRRRPG